MFFIPYAQIDYFGYQKPVKDTDFHALFGGLVVPPPPVAVPAAQRVVPAEPLAPAPLRPSAQGLSKTNEPAPAEAPAEPVSPPAVAADGKQPVIKSAILERFRARHSQQGLQARPPGE